MSQATNWGMPLTGPKAPVTVNTETNESFDAILSQHSDATSRPSYAVAGSVWVKTVSATQNEWYWFDGTDDILIATVDYTANTITFTSSNGIESLTTAEVNQLENIGTTTISATQWGYLGAMSSAIVGVDMTQTLTNKTLTSPDINGGTVDGAPIGATTPSTGAFTTLTTSSTAFLGAGINFTGLTNFLIQTDVGTGNPGIVFDSNNYLDYNRTTDTMRVAANTFELNAPGAATEKLHLNGATPTVRIGSETGSAYGDIRRDSTGEIHYDAAQATFGEHVFDIAGVEAFRIDNTSNATFSGNALASPDNTNTLGGASNRWSVVYAGTGTINTSDERLKEQFTDVSDQEKAAAFEIKQAIKKYKFSDAVNEKGETARWHFGVGAQTVKAIMESHGLVADEYGFFCHDEWAEETKQRQINEGETTTVTKTREVQATETVSEEVTSIELIDGQYVQVTNEVYAEVPLYDEFDLYEDGEIIGTHKVPRMITEEYTEDVATEPVYETVITREAGDRYGIRYDELAMFILGAL